MKLIPRLGDKINYVLHSRNLQLYLSRGIKLTKIHKVLKFKQSDWMKKYIDFNTVKRINTANSIEKKCLNWWSIVSMAKQWKIYEKKVNFRLVNNEKHFLKDTSISTHITHKIFHKNYAAIHEIKPVLKLNKPIYVGFTALELSKRITYDFNYHVIKKNFDAELLFTDSLTYEIKSENVYEEFFNSKDLFVFSYYPKDSKFFDQSNKNVIGKIKDVSERKITDEFVALKSKMYSMKNIDSKESKTAKKVNIATEFNEFKDTLFYKKVLRHKRKRFQNKKHKIGKYEIEIIIIVFSWQKICFRWWNSYTYLFYWRVTKIDLHRWS